MGHEYMHRELRTHSIGFHDHNRRNRGSKWQSSEKVDIRLDIGVPTPNSETGICRIDYFPNYAKQLHQT